MFEVALPCPASALPLLCDHERVGVLVAGLLMHEVPCLEHSESHQYTRLCTRNGMRWLARKATLQQLVKLPSGLGISTQLC